MTRRDVDEFLAQCDDVLTDWDDRFAPDAATWTADGSHEHAHEVDCDGGDDPDQWAALNLGGGMLLIAPVGTPAPDGHSTEGWVEIGGTMQGASVGFVVMDEALDAFDEAPGISDELWDAVRHEPVIAQPAPASRAQRRAQRSAGTSAQRSPYGPADRVPGRRG